MRLAPLASALVLNLAAALPAAAQQYAAAVQPPAPPPQSQTAAHGFTAPGRWLEAFGYSAGGWLPERYPRRLADVDGDGRQDLVGFGWDGVSVSLSTGEGFTPPALWLKDFGYGDAAGHWREGKHLRLLADVNGDRRADIVGFGDDGVHVALSTGHGFAPRQLVLADFGAGKGAGSWRSDLHPRHLADVTGDGLPDIVGFGDGGVYVAPGDGRGFARRQLWLADFGAGEKAGSWRTGRHLRLLADMDGDHRADVVGFGDQGVHVALAGDGAFTPRRQWLNDFGHDQGEWRLDRHPRYLADVDGDGRADVVGLGDRAAYVALSDGHALSPRRTWLEDFGYESGNWRVGQHLRTVLDVDGDRRADLVGFGDRGMYVALSTGEGFAERQLAMEGLGGDDGWESDHYLRRLADVDGDGRLDAVGFGDDGVYVGLNR